MNAYTPKYDDMSEEDFYLGFMLVVRERTPSLAEAISNDKTNEQTKQALDVALSFYDTSLQIAGGVKQTKGRKQKAKRAIFSKERKQ